MTALQIAACMRQPLLIVSAGAAFALWFQAAEAQSIDNYVPSAVPGYDVMPGVTVASRVQPSFDPLGIRLGGTLIEPQVTQGIGYDSNVLGSNKARSSFTLETQGAVHSSSVWTGNTLILDLSADHVGYSDISSQSYTNWSAGGGWIHEIGPDSLGVGISHYSLNQLPVGIDSIGVLRPIPYQTNSARLSYKFVRGAFTIVPIADFTATRFDTAGSDGILTSRQDRNVETGAVTVFYELAPRRNVVVELRGTVAQYLHGTPQASYNDVTILTGFDYDATAVLRFRALAGFEQRSYQASAFTNNSSPVIEGTAIWTPSGLTTVTASVTHRIEDANEFVETGYKFSQVRLVVDHELQRNVVIQGRGWVEKAAYLSSSSEQTLYGAGLTLTYRLNRNVRLVGTYDFTDSHATSGLAANYTRSVVLLALRFAV